MGSRGSAREPFRVAKDDIVVIALHPPPVPIPLYGNTPLTLFQSPFFLEGRDVFVDADIPVIGFPGGSLNSSDGSSNSASTSSKICPWVWFFWSVDSPFFFPLNCFSGCPAVFFPSRLLPAAHGEGPRIHHVNRTAAA